MKKRLLFLGYLLITTIFLSCNFSSQETTIEKLRRKHRKILKEHPFAKQMQLSRKDRKALGLPPNDLMTIKHYQVIM